MADDTASGQAERGRCVLCGDPLPEFPATLVRDPYDPLGPLCDKHSLLIGNGRSSRG